MRVSVFGTVVALAATLMVVPGELLARGPGGGGGGGGNRGGGGGASRSFSGGGGGASRSFSGGGGGAPSRSFSGGAPRSFSGGAGNGPSSINRSFGASPSLGSRSPGSPGFGGSGASGVRSPSSIGRPGVGGAPSFSTRYNIGTPSGTPGRGAGGLGSVGSGTGGRGPTGLGSAGRTGSPQLNGVPGVSQSSSFATRYAAGQNRPNGSSGGAGPGSVRQPSGTIGRGGANLPNSSGIAGRGDIANRTNFTARYSAGSLNAGNFGRTGNINGPGGINGPGSRNGSGNFNRPGDNDSNRFNYGAGSNRYGSGYNRYGYGSGSNRYGYGGFGNYSRFGYGNYGYNRYGYGGYGGYGYRPYGYGYGYGPWGYWATRLLFGIRPLLGYGYGGYGYGGYGGYGNSYASNHYSTYSPIVTTPVVTEALPATDRAGDFAAQGEANFQAGNYEQAVKDWQHALVDDPNNATLVMLMSQGLFATGKYDEAAGALQAALQGVPQDKWNTVVGNYRELYGNAQDYTDQLRALETAGEKTESPAMQFLLGYHYGFLGFPKEAVRELDKGLKLAPEDVLAKQMRDMFAAKISTPPAAVIPKS